MSADAILIVQFLFQTIWRFFNSWYIPGTNVTPAAMAFFLLVSAFVLRSLGYLLNRAGAFDAQLGSSSDGVERVGRVGGRRL